MTALLARGSDGATCTVGPVIVRSVVGRGHQNFGSARAFAHN